MDPSIGSLIAITFLMALLTVISAPFITQFSSPNVTQQFSEVNSTTQALLVGHLYNNLNKTVYSTSGFGASFINSLGFAFIFPAISVFVQAIAQIPSIFLLDLNLIATSTGLFSTSGVSLVAVIGIGLAYLGLMLLIKLVSSWQKFDIWSA